MDSIQKLIVVQLGRIGDVILQTPLLYALKHTFPEAEIHFLAGRNNAVVAEQIPIIDRVHVHDKIITHLPRLFRTLKREKFDLWIDPKDHYSSESRIFAKHANARFRVGYNEPEKKPAFNIEVPPHDDQFEKHIVDRNLNILRLMGQRIDRKFPLKLESQPETDVAVKQFLTDTSISGYTLINISASKPSRYWPQSSWIDFINSFDGHHFILSADPKDQDKVTEILNETKNAFFFNTRSIIDVYSTVKFADLVISPDTSVIHIAAAFDRPVIGLYANRDWNLHKFHPLSTENTVLINEESDSLIDGITIERLMEVYSVMISALVEK